MDNKPEPIAISTDKSKLDLKWIHDYLSTQSYWAKGRSLKTVQISIENSLCFGVYAGSQQIGFARVVTDYSVFAWLMDVFIASEFQNKGIGKKLIKHIMNHPQLANLQKWGLNTWDAHDLYKKFGFKNLKRPQVHMEMTPKCF